jgi:Family of unknown function (DUF6559)
MGSDRGVRDVPLRELTNAEMAKLAGKVGGDLIKSYGKRKHYSMAMVTSSARRQSIPSDCLSWAYALFSSEPEFDEIHADYDDDFNYVRMRAQIKRALSIYTSAPAFGEDATVADAALVVLPVILTMFD